MGPDYCVRPPQTPIYVFCLDVSPNAVEAGLTEATLQALKEGVRGGVLPGGEKARMGLVTFASKVQFYRIGAGWREGGKEGEEEEEGPPSVYVLGDVDDPFAALPPDQWIVSDKNKFLAFLDHVPALSFGATAAAAAAAAAAAGGNGGGGVEYAQMREREEAASVAAVEAVGDALATLGGKVFMFTASR